MTNGIMVPRLFVFIYCPDYSLVIHAFSILKGRDDEAQNYARIAILDI